MATPRLFYVQFVWDLGMDSSISAYWSQALHGVDMRTAKQKREAGDQPPAEATQLAVEILTNLLRWLLAWPTVALVNVF